MHIFSLCARLTAFWFELHTYIKYFYLSNIFLFCCKICSSYLLRWKVTHQLSYSKPTQMHETNKTYLI